MVLGISSEDLIPVRNQGRAPKQCGGVILPPNGDWQLVPVSFMHSYGWDRALVFDFSSFQDRMATRAEGRFTFDWWCPISMVDGYGRHALAIFRGFRMLNCDPILRDVDWVDKLYLTSDVEAARFQGMYRVPNKIGCVMSLPYDDHIHNHQSVNKIVITQFETNKIPEKHVAKVSNCHHLIVTSKYQVKVWKNSGLNIPISVMTPGIDTDFFSYRERIPDGKFKILLLGAITGRKNPIAAMRIFKIASGGSPDWRLTIKTRRTDAVRQIEIAAAQDPRIEVVVGDSHPDSVLQYYHNNDVLLWPCFSEDTKIMSREGFKSSDELEEGDEVLTVNPETRKIEKDIVIRKWVKPYNGSMIHFGNNRLNILVTPNHRIYYSTPKLRNKLQVRHAGEFLGTRTRYHIPVTAISDGVEDDFVSLKHISSQSIHHSTKQLPEKVLTSDLMKLFGWYISEGSIYNPVHSRPSKGRSGSIVSISNKDIDNRTEIINVLEAFGQIANSSQPTVVTTSSIQLAELLTECGGNALEKTIPGWLLEYSPRHLRILFDTLMKGDGSTDGNHATYYTSSVKLRDRFIELCYRLGYAVKIYERPGVDRYIEGRFVSKDNTKISYAIGISKIYSEGSFDGSDVSEINYNGNVWCIETRNQTVIAMRQGSVFVSGNSKGEGVGLPPLEMMSTGGELVCSDNSGMADFVDDNHCYPIRTAYMEPASIPGQGFSAEYIQEFGDVGDWWVPDETHAIQQLQKCYDNWRIGKGKGFKAAQYVRKYHNLLIQAQSILNVLMKYE